MITASYVSVKSIVCPVCQRLRTAAPLCDQCRATPGIGAFIRHLLGGVTTQQASAYNAWMHLCELHLGKWEQLLNARNDADYAERCAKARAAGNVYGQLLDAHDAYEASMAALGDERRRLEQAREAV